MKSISYSPHKVNILKLKNTGNLRRIFYLYRNVPYKRQILRINDRFHVYTTLVFLDFSVYNENKIKNILERGDILYTWGGSFNLTSFLMPVYFSNAAGSLKIPLTM